MEEANINRLELEGKTIILVPTAHVSKDSAKEVKEIIALEQPDAVCVELDEQRYESIKNKDKWKNTDIVTVIKEKKAGFMLANIILSNYQRKIAEQFDIQAGQEMIQGIESAKEFDKELVLADRNIQTTFLRLWRGVSFIGKIKLLFSLMLGVIDDEEITEEDLEKMKTEDMLSSALHELGESFPDVKQYLVDERDRYLAEKIRQAPGQKVVAILGAAHTPGIRTILAEEPAGDISELETIPPKSSLSKVLGWAIPFAVLVLIAMTFHADTSTGLEQIKSFALWVGSLAFIGAALARAHIYSAVVAFIMAPISVVNPLIATGWFAGLMEAHLRKPKVEDFEGLATDLYTIKGFWKNKVTRILLVTAFANLGSMVGLWIGGAGLVHTFIETVL